MREIKFRAKPEDPSAFGFDFVYGYPLANYMADWEIFSQDEFVPVIPETIGEYTGLTDKNGKEVYEGDICKMMWTTANYRGYFQSSDAYQDFEENVEVKYFDEGFKFFKKDGKQFNNRKNLDLVVVGNIHENPELLEK